VGARVRILLVLVRVSGAKRPSFVLLSPSVHAATVNRYTAACMESKEDEEAWRSARERERKSAQLTHFLGADESRSLARPPDCVLSTTSSCTTMHTTHHIYISPWLLSRALSPAPRCAHALLVCLKLAHWQFCLIVWVCCVRARAVRIMQMARQI
jgi:hypothetical protein